MSQGMEVTQERDGCSLQQWQMSPLTQCQVCGDASEIKISAIKLRPFNWS